MTVMKKYQNYLADVWDRTGISGIWSDCLINCDTTKYKRYIPSPGVINWGIQSK